MKNGICLFLAMFLPLLGFTQSGTKSNFYMKPVGFQIPAFDSKGYNPLFPESVTNLADQNPAALSDFKSMQTGISWRFFSKLETDNQEKEFGQTQPFIPASAGFVYPVNSFVFALGYVQKFNFALVSEKMPVTNIDFPDGTGEFFTWEEKTIHHFFSLSGAWKIENILFSSDQFSAGVHLGYNQLHFYRRIWTTSAESFPKGLSWATGMQYLINFENEYKIKSGLFFEKGSKINATYKYGSVQDLVGEYNDDTSNTNGIIQAILTSNSWPMIADFPDRLHAGFEISTPENFSFSLKGSYVWMDQTWTSFKNQLNVAGNVGIPITENLRVTGGFYSDTQNDNYSEFYYEIFKVKSSGYRSLFLTTGVNFVWQNFTIDLALADNHFSSGEYRTQTHFKAGVNYTF